MTDLDTISVRRVGSRLEPMGEYDEERLREVREGKEFRIAIVPVRNPSQERYLHALTKKAQEALGEPDYDEFRQSLYLAARHVEKRITADGSVVTVAASVSPFSGRMTIARYTRLIGRIKDVLWLMFGLDWRDLMNEVERGQPDRIRLDHKVASRWSGTDGVLEKVTEEMKCEKRRS